MDYRAPSGSIDPDAHYVDKDTPGAVSGSKVPAKAIENPQRELTALVSKSGLTPSITDLTQVPQAVRSQKLNYLVAGGTANALTATPDPALAAFTNGLPLRILITATNTATDPILTVPGLAAVTIKRSGGGGLAPGDLTAGDTPSLVFDGTYLRLDAPARSDLRAAASAPATTQKITATGAFSSTVPPGVYSIKVRGWGAGGGGGYANTYNSSAPSGGGAGGYGERTFVVAPGDVVTGSVGAGGTGGNGFPGQPGQSGGATTITVNGVTMTCGGGAGGLNTSTANTVANGSSGGSVTGADLAIPGEGGWIGIRIGGGAVASGGYGGAAPLGGGSVPGGAGGASAGLAPGGGGGATSDTGIAGGIGARGEAHIIYATP